MQQVAFVGNVIHGKAHGAVHQVRTLRFLSGYLDLNKIADIIVIVGGTTILPTIILLLVVLIFNKTSFTPNQQNKIRLNVNKTRFALHIVLYSIDMRSIERSEVLYSTDMSCKGDVRLPV